MKKKLLLASVGLAGAAAFLAVSATLLSGPTPEGVLLYGRLGLSALYVSFAGLTTFIVGTVYPKD